MRVLRFGVIVMVAGLQLACGEDTTITETPVADVQIDMGVADLDGDGLTGDKDNCPEVDNPKQEDLDEDGTGDACDLDDDGDGVLDEFDTCPTLANPDRLDSDGDGRGDACDDDDDNDEFPDDVDVCPLIPNADQKNTDGDDYGDVCDDDRDGDTWLNEEDNCPDVANMGQLDMDEDGIGDDCDDDIDADGYPNNLDLCPNLSNAPDGFVPGGEFVEQADIDGDGIGDDCDDDLDADGILNVEDNCPRDSNPNQTDEDGDGIGDACDGCSDDANDDTDRDGLCADVDNCPDVSNATQVDVDEDGVGDACDQCPQDSLNDDDEDGVCGAIDNCPNEANSEQLDTDNDGIGDACDVCPRVESNDGDGDGVCVAPPGEPGGDNCPADANPEQTDSDEDGIGDECDICPFDPNNDRDGDSVCAAPDGMDGGDNCPEVANPDQADFDSDGIGDACDVCTEGGPLDPDGDAYCSGADNCPDVFNPPAEGEMEQADGDGDGIGDVCDIFPTDPENDKDGDGHELDGGRDNCPEIANNQSDIDGDSIGDACDDNNDGDDIPDIEDNCPLTDNPDQVDRSPANGIGDACESIYFYEDFEDGLAENDWIIGAGDWLVSREAAVTGLQGLVENAPSNGPALLQTRAIDLSDAVNPRVAFEGRFDLANSTFDIIVVVGGVDQGSPVQIYGDGHSGRAFGLYSVDLSAYRGEADVSIKLRVPQGQASGPGVWIDDFRIEESPQQLTKSLPFYEHFETLDNWVVLSGGWSFGVDSWIGDRAIEVDESQTDSRGVSVLELRGGVDLRGSSKPRLSFWIRSSAMTELNELEVELMPYRPDDSGRLVLDADTVKRVLVRAEGPVNPYYERFDILLDEFVDVSRLGVRFNFRYWGDPGAWVRLDAISIDDVANLQVMSVPQSLQVPDQRLVPETDGWGTVEEPIGSKTLRSSAQGALLNSEVRLSLGRYNLEDAVAPEVGVWVRYALRAAQQTVFLEYRPMDAPERNGRIVVLEATGENLENGELELRRIRLPDDAKSPNTELVIGVKTLDDAEFGLDLAEIYVTDALNQAAVEAPIIWDFEEVSYFASDFEEDVVDHRWTAVTGEWSRSVNGAIDGRYALVGKAKLDVEPIEQVVEAESPIFDLSSAVSPQLVFDARFDVPNNEVDLIVLRKDGDAFIEILTQNIVPDDYERRDERSILVDMSPYRGHEIKVRLRARLGQEELRGVWLDNLRLGEPSPFSTLGGLWNVVRQTGRFESVGLRLVSRPGLRGLPTQNAVKLSPAVDLSAVSHPRLEMWVRYLNNAPRHQFVLKAESVEPQRITWIEPISINEGDASAARSSGFQKLEFSLAPVAGQTKVSFVLEAKVDSDEPLDVVVDEIIVGDALNWYDPRTPEAERVIASPISALSVAEITVDANRDYVLYVNEAEIGRGSGFLSGDRYYVELLRPAPQDLDDGACVPGEVDNLVALEVDGPGAGTTAAITVRLGDMVIRSGDIGWKSGSINEDGGDGGEVPDDGIAGSIDEGWMNLDFDDSGWDAVLNNKPFVGQGRRGSYLLFDDQLGARFMSHVDEDAAKQLFRRRFTVIDSDCDGVPDPVDGNSDYNNPAPDLNGNGIDDENEVPCAGCTFNVLNDPGVVVTASSIRESDESRYGSTKVTDGQSRCSGWQAAAADGAASITFELGRVMLVCSAVVFNETDCGSYESGSSQWSMYVSNQLTGDGNDILVASSDIGSQPPAYLPKAYRFSQGGVGAHECFEADHIRIDVPAKYGDYAGLGEVMIFGINP